MYVASFVLFSRIFWLIYTNSLLLIKHIYFMLFLEIEYKISLLIWFLYCMYYYCSHFPDPNSCEVDGDRIIDS